MLTSAMLLDMSEAFDGRVNHETLMLKMQNVGASNSLIQWFCSYLMKDDKWFESIQYCQSPYPLTAAFSGEVYSDHFYLAYTLIDLPSAPQKCSVQSYVDDARQVISFKMKHIVNPFADLRDYLHRIGRWCSNNLICWIQAKPKLWCLVAGQCIPDWSLPASLSWEENPY